MSKQEGCECALERVAMTGVEPATFQTALEMTLSAAAGGSVAVTHVEELAVSAAAMSDDESIVEVGDKSKAVHIANETTY